MGYRRSSRELAMQALYYIDMGKNDQERAFRLFCINFEPSDDVMPFFQQLVKGTLEHRDKIDRKIETFSSNWKLSRMSGVDRNVIRIAVYELMFCHDIPSKVSINEAIDIGKKYGTADSGAFINGILDAISIDIDKAVLS
ncbi:MAG: transcription antitermination factor NusB [Proteobacteria bacterium]|nr:transcription antitermination factor NusB [Pseudomonadota bacterium]